MATPSQRGAPATAPAFVTVNTIMGAGLPVLVSGAGDPGPSTHAIGIIRDEHRSLAAMLHAWMHVLATARSAGVAADPDLMHAIVRYIEAFAVALHQRRRRTSISSPACASAPAR